jgi:hypothetical protein
MHLASSKVSLLRVTLLHRSDYTVLHCLKETEDYHVYGNVLEMVQKVWYRALQCHPLTVLPIHHHVNKRKLLHGHTQHLGETADFKSYGMQIMSKSPGDIKLGYRKD